MDYVEDDFGGMDEPQDPVETYQWSISVLLSFLQLRALLPVLPPGMFGRPFSGKGSLESGPLDREVRTSYHP